MSDIVVKFKPDGHKQLIAAIQKLELAQGKASKGSRKFSENIGRNRKAMSLFENSLATIRSRLLIYNFLMGVGVAQMVKFAQQAAKLQQVQRAFTSMSGGANNATASIRKLQAATNGTISEIDLFTQANNAMILGVTKNSDEMAEMFDMAQRLGDALGRDVQTSIESLVTGIGRQSRLMLDNIGIIVKSDQAYENYARELGKTASTLTDSEKKQAFMNAALEAGAEKLKFLPQETQNATKTFQQLNSALSDASNEIGMAFLPLIELVAKAMITISDAFSADRVRAYATVISVGLGSAMAFYIKQLDIAIIKQSRLGWGLLITTAGILGTELLRLIGIFDTYEDEVSDAAAANMTYLQGLKSLKEVQLAEELNKQKSMLQGLHPEYEKLIQEQERLQTLIDSGTLKNKTSIKTYGNIKRKVNEQEEAERKLAAVKEELRIIEENGIEVSEKEEKQIKNNIKTIEEQLKVIDAGFSTYKAYLEQGEDAKELYNKTFEAQKATIEQQITEQENLMKIEGATAAHVAVLDQLKKKKEELIETNILDAKFEDLTTNMKLKALGKLASATGALIGENKKNALIAARLDQTSALINTYVAVTDVLKEGSGPMRYVEAAAALAFGLAQVGKIENALSQMGGTGGGGGGGSQQAAYGMEQGGLVGGQRHSYGGTLIEAEQGEFVMSRAAVNSIGLEALNQMNSGISGSGTINVNISGNVMTQDFVEGQLAESIKEAVRRGSDFGMN